MLCFLCKEEDSKLKGSHSFGELSQLFQHVASHILKAFKKNDFCKFQSAIGYLLADCFAHFSFDLLESTLETFMRVVKEDKEDPNNFRKYFVQKCGYRLCNVDLGGHGVDLDAEEGGIDDSKNNTISFLKEVVMVDDYFDVLNEMRYNERAKVKVWNITSTPERLKNLRQNSSSFINSSTSQASTSTNLDANTSKLKNDSKNNLNSSKSTNLDANTSKLRKVGKSI